MVNHLVADPDVFFFCHEVFNTTSAASSRDRDGNGVRVPGAWKSAARGKKKTVEISSTFSEKRFAASSPNFGPFAGSL
jgi:hypothetical protein